MNITKYVEKNNLEIKPVGIGVGIDFMNNLTMTMKGLLVQDATKEKKILEVIFVSIFGLSLFYDLYKEMVDIGFLCIAGILCLGSYIACCCIADYLLGSTLLNTNIKQAVYVNTNYTAILKKFIPITDELAKSTDYLMDKKRIQGRKEEWLKDINAYDFLLFEYQGYYFCLKAEKEEFVVSEYSSVIDSLRADVNKSLTDICDLVEERSDTIFKIVAQTGLDLMGKLGEIQEMVEELGDDVTPEIDEKLIRLKLAVEKFDKLSKKLNILK